jgi:simple sugar transport system permease protein
MSTMAEPDILAGAAASRGGVLAAALRFVLSTKLYWGLALLLLMGVLSSPVNSRGVNIFLSPGNLSNVLRQVSNNGMVAVGMTLVILTGGIDLSVGSILALGSVLCAMLLTMEGWTSAAVISIPVFGIVVLFLVAWAVPAIGAARSTPGAPPRNLRTGSLLGAAAVAALAVWWAAAMVPGKFGVAGVLAVVPTVGLVLGALNGFIIAKGRLQPFIVTLAMMVGILGMARLVTGQDQSVVPVYAGTNATEDIELLRALLWGVLPIPGLFFLAACGIFAVLLGTTTFGRYVYAIGGNEQATRLSGVAVDRVKIAVYGLSGMLASLAGVLYTAQYLQGKPDAGEGIELDAIAAVVIGGTSLMGGKGSIGGTLVGVLIFGFLSNILQLNNIDSNTQLVLKGLIILAAVLLQEGQAGRLLGPLRGLQRGPPRAPG